MNQSNLLASDEKFREWCEPLGIVEFIADWDHVRHWCLVGGLFLVGSTLQQLDLCVRYGDDIFARAEAFIRARRAELVGTIS